MILPPLQLSGNITPGTLLGTTGTQELIQSINQNLGMSSEYFGSVHDIFNKGRQVFMQNIIEPIRQIGTQIRSAANKLLRNDVIAPLITPDDYQYVPPSMHMPILMYEPVRKLHKQGRVYGFGYEPENLPDEDVYGRLINNGSMNTYVDLNTKGEYTLEWTWKSSDPELEFTELDHIEQTRQYLDEILRDQLFDPTDYDSPLR
jgi:hypothetical protein